MTKNVVSDEHLGILARRQHDLFRRVREGTVPIEFALEGMQALIEGRQPTGGGPYRDAPAPMPPTFEVWRRLTIGGKTKDQLIAALESKGFKIGDWARDMLGQEAFMTLPEPTEVALVRLTVGELGFLEGTTTKKLFAKAKALGLRLCPAEVGPHLRLADADQAHGEWYWIGMDPITGSDRYPNVFEVERGVSGRWLNGGDARPSDRWLPEGRIVFCVAGK